MNVTNKHIGIGMHSPKIYGGGWLYYHPPQYGWLTGQPSGPNTIKSRPPTVSPLD